MTATASIDREIADSTHTFIHQNERDVRRALRILHGSRPFEIRILKIPGRGKPHNAAGYFNNIDLAAKLVVQFDLTRQPGAIYTAMNEINPALFARSPNAITEYLEDTATDRDIMGRRWILIDADPVRPAGISSTDGELSESMWRADAIFDWLRNRYWPEPVIAESGNGMHLLFPIDMPNDAEATRTITSILAGLQSEFGDGARFAGRLPVNIDCKVFNAARITKLYGTWTRKGCSTTDRPHRRTRIIYVPDYLESGL
jgi:hypothetical protein